jgi:hypothetical protein
VLPLWCRDTSPRFVWWHHDLPCETIQVKSPTMRPTGRRVTSSRRDGKTGREIREHALAINSVPLGAAVPRLANL